MLPYFGASPNTTHNFRGHNLKKPVSSALDKSIFGGESSVFDRFTKIPA
jgi:hypothetical protein